MPVCAKCGHANPEGSRFCNACAAPLQPATPSPYTPSVQQALSDLKSDDSALDADVTPLGGEDEPDVYVRWEGWPWSTLSAREQTYDQFAISSIIGFVVIALLAVVYTLAINAVCGLAWVIVLLAVWYIQWRVGREGAMGLR